MGFADKFIELLKRPKSTGEKSLTQDSVEDLQQRSEDIQRRIDTNKAYMNSGDRDMTGPAIDRDRQKNEELEGLKANLDAQLSNIQGQSETNPVSATSNVVTAESQPQPPNTGSIEQPNSNPTGTSGNNGQ